MRQSTRASTGGTDTNQPPIWRASLPANDAHTVERRAWSDALTVVVPLGHAAPERALAHPGQVRDNAPRGLPERMLALSGRAYHPAKSPRSAIPYVRIAPRWRPCAQVGPDEAPTGEPLLHALRAQVTLCSRMAPQVVEPTTDEQHRLLTVHLPKLHAGAPGAPVPRPSSP